MERWKELFTFTTLAKMSLFKNTKLTQWKSQECGWWQRKQSLHVLRTDFYFWNPDVQTLMMLKSSLNWAIQMRTCSALMYLKINASLTTWNASLVIVVAYFIWLRDTFSQLPSWLWRLKMKGISLLYGTHTVWSFLPLASKLEWSISSVIASDSVSSLSLARKKTYLKIFTALDMLGQM